MPQSWFRTKVKVYPHVTGQTCGAHDVILDKLHSKRSPQVEVTTGWQESDIIIIFCPVTSRVGADVQAAMRKVTGNKKTWFDSFFLWNQPSLQELCSD